MNLSKFIKHIRKQLNLSQVDLAVRLDVTQSTVSGWENQMKSLSRKSFINLKKFCSTKKIEFTLKDIFK